MNVPRRWWSWLASLYHTHGTAVARGHYLASDIVNHLTAAMSDEACYWQDTWMSEEGSTTIDIFTPVLPFITNSDEDI